MKNFKEIHKIPIEIIKEKWAPPILEELNINKTEHSLVGATSDLGTSPNSLMS